MRIIAFEQAPTRFAGGQERSFFEVLTWLSAAGHEIHLFYTQSGELIPEYEKAGISTAKLSARQLKPQKAANIIADIVRARKWIHSIQPDFLYVNQYPDTPFPALAGWITGTPLIVHLRLPCPHYLSRQYKWGLRRTTGCIAISRATQRGYIDAGIKEQKVRVLHNAIDINQIGFYETTDNSETRKISYLGRLCPEKGVEVLIRTFKKLATVRKDMTLELVGNVRGAGIDPQAYMRHLKDMAGNLLNDRIIFRAHQSNINANLTGTDLVVLPSIWQEPFGRVLIEAMAAGIPPIGSDIGGIPEVLRPIDSELLFNPNDEESLMSTILNTIDLKRRNTKFRQRLRKEAEESYSLQKYIPALEGIFKEFLSEAN